MIIIIVAYAPTLQVSEKLPQKREDFYKEIDKLLTKKKRSNYTVFLLGDFNPTRGSGHYMYKENIGKYGKCHMKSNREYLLNTLGDNEMLITNTSFNHKLAHRITWFSPQRNEDIHHHDGTVRPNPYRNQNNYITVKKSHRDLINNSRCYGAFQAETDNKLVKMQIRIDW